MDFKLSMILLQKMTMYLQEADWVVVLSFLDLSCCFKDFERIIWKNSEFQFGLNPKQQVSGQYSLASWYASSFYLLDFYSN